VTVIDNLSSGKREHVPSAATFIEADIQSPEARQVIAEGGFAIVNHHAAQIDVRISVTDPALDARINLLGLLNLLEGARAGGVKRFIFASSGGVVYGESDRLPHDEEARKLPISPYGVSKLASEFYLATYAQLYGMETVALRYANVYGPRQNPHGEAGVVAIFGSRALKGTPLTIFGDGSQTRDYVFVEDVARANLAASRSRVPTPATIDSAAYNVGTATETSVTQLAKTLLSSAGVSVPIVNAAARAGELQRSAVGIGKAARELGWKPQVTLAEGLRKTYQWIAGAAACRHRPVDRSRQEYSILSGFRRHPRSRCWSCWRCFRR
jgi:UDP-glucose 4-epimerase